MSQALDMWFFLFLVYGSGLVQGLSRVDPLVTTKGGLIRGLLSDQGFAKFLGVPYAVVDRNNPFGAAAPHPGFESTFEAYESNACPQVDNDVVFGTLDCLTLDIYVPRSANSHNRLPVMVWIHGGAFVMGSGAAFGPPNPLLRNDVIVVAINYRLGVYGFMCLDIPEVPGNQGLKDQVLALRWINENIEEFGGNARQITVFGESAGGISVNLHLLSSYESLFQKAIIQSGPAIKPLAIVESDNTLPLKLAAALDFNTEDTVEALNYLASINVLTLTKLAYDLKISYFGGTEQPVTFPCVERNFEGVEHFITQDPMNIVSNKVRNTPIIIGNNDNEMPFMYGNVTAEYLSNYDFDLVSLGFDLGDSLEDALNDVKHFYVGDEDPSEEFRDEITDFASDFMYNHPTQRMAERFLDVGAGTVYRYIFSYSGGRNYLKLTYNLNSTGAIHADELGYLFDSDIFNDDAITHEDELMVERMSTLWANFATYGDPTPETSELLPVKWEPITRTSQPYLNLDFELTLEGRPFQDRMAFWDVFYRLHRDQQKWFAGSKK